MIDDILKLIVIAIIAMFGYKTLRRPKKRKPYPTPPRIQKVEHDDTESVASKIDRLAGNLRDD